VGGNDLVDNTTEVLVPDDSTDNVPPSAIDDEQVSVVIGDTLVDLADFMAVNPVQDPDFEFPQGNGLFVFNPDPNSNFLIETNPAFTQFSNFVSSDFFLERLGFSPDDDVRRLGDSFYEARLIEQAILDATGARYLSSQFTSRNDQLIYLYENAIASQASLELTVGVSLSAAQVAALTHDIVWLEEQVVTTPDGKQVTVLAPVVYLASTRPNQFQSNGAVIVGNDVNLISPDNVFNSGQVNATNNLVVNAQQNIINVGTLNATNNVGLTAQNSIVNSSTSLQNALISGGNNVDLTAQNGNIILERTVSTVAGENANQTYRFDSLNGESGIQAGNNLNLNAAKVEMSRLIH